MAEIRTTVYTGIQELAAMQPEWLNLMERSKFPTPFQHPAWVLPWWEVYGQESRLLAIGVWQGAELIGLAMLFLSADGNLPLLGARRTVRFLGSNEACADYLHFLALPGREEEVAAGVFALLEEHREKWDEILLTDVPESALGLHLRGVSKMAGLSRWGVGEDTVCPYLPLPGDWQELLARLSPGMRKTVRGKWNRLHRKHRLEFRRAASPVEVEHAYGELVRLHQLRWNSAGLWGSFASGAFREFHRKVVRRALEDHMLQLYTLRVDGRTVASLYGFAYGGRFFYYQMGTDPRYSNESVGLVLLSGVIQEAIREGLKEFDFLRGDAEYKRRWRPRYRRNYRIWADQRGLGNELRYRSKKMFELGKRKVKSALPEQVWTEIRHKIHRRY